MKAGENWLREWVNPSLNTQQLADQLTMAGLEIDSVTPLEGTQVFEVNVTPNRGDCLSVMGLARELAVLNQLPLNMPSMDPVKTTHTDKLAVEIKAPQDCARYVGRIIKGIRQVQTPDEITKKLSQCGINLIHPVVDILNYVMLELGQPMHAFDADKLQGTITVRVAKPAEEIIVLGGQKIALAENALVIADHNGAQAIAGIIGGEASAVGEGTKNIFLESALFTMQKIAGKARLMGLHTESSYRFERGVDPEMQVKAMERATQLILQVCGGEAGPIVECVEEASLPRKKSIPFRPSRYVQIIGDQQSNDAIKVIFEKLHCQVESKGERWEVIPPSFRYDLNEEVDLIEEIARIVGYNQIHSKKHTGSQSSSQSISSESIPEARIKRYLADLGYQEAITYSFVDDKDQQRLFPGEEALALLNPISSEMGVMRLSLWTGLLNAVRYNQHRQQHRIRLFEVGQCFRESSGENYLGGVVCGAAEPENWSASKREVDFFDVKGHIESLFRTLGHSTVDLAFRPVTVPACHPGQCAEIVWNGKKVGLIGKLHPQVQKEWDLEGGIYLFQIAMKDLQRTGVTAYLRPSKFTENRRDLALLVDEGVSAENLVSCVKKNAGELLQDLIIFDVYMGKGIEPGKKSVALGLILQHPSRTLVDQEIDSVVQDVVVGLQKECNAKLRDS